MTRGTRVAMSIVAWVAILFGIGYLASSIIDGYMVTVGGTTPGEPMFLDELAYPLRDAILGGAIGTGLIAVGAIFRVYVSRKARAAS